jgi:hypothetical protein
MTLEEQRLQHAVDHHGLRWEPCPGCSYTYPLAACAICGGTGIVYQLRQQPCGPDCPLPAGVLS